MKKRNIFAVLLLIVFAFTTACGGNRTGGSTPAPTPTPSPVSTPTPTPAPTPTPDPVALALAAMTTEQKVGQLMVAGIEGKTAGEDAARAVQQYQVGGVILFSRNVESAPQLAALNHELRALNGDYTPLFLCVDQEGGRVSRMPPEVGRTPSALKVAEAGVAAEFGAVLAAQCAAFGFNVDFAPSLDIWSNPDNTVIGDRAFGTDWERVELYGSQCAAALMAGGIIPVVKHFPGHGDTSVDSHKELPVVNKSLYDLQQSELAPFSCAISGKDCPPVPAVMVAHILMTQLDPKYPASLSPAVVTDLLRGDMGFEGVVFTDDLTMGAISNTYGMGEAAVLALEAGCDGLLVCHKTENLKAAYEAVLAAVASGRISIARLDESVYRILSLKREYALSNDAVEPPDVAALNEQIAALMP